MQCYGLFILLVHSLAKNLANATFSRSQKLHLARTLCTKLLLNIHSKQQLRTIVSENDCHCSFLLSMRKITGLNTQHPKTGQTIEHLSVIPTGIWIPLWKFCNLGLVRQQVRWCIIFRGALLCNFILKNYLIFPSWRFYFHIRPASNIRFWMKNHGMYMYYFLFLFETFPQNRFCQLAVLFCSVSKKRMCENYYVSFPCKFLQNDVRFWLWWVFL